MDSDTNKIESKKSDPSVKQSTEWLAENQSEMDHSFKKMLKLIEENTQSLTNSAELVAGIEESKRIYQALAQRFKQLTLELVNDSDRDQDDSFFSPFNPSHKKFETFNFVRRSSDPSPNSKMIFTKFGIKFGTMDSGNDSSDPSSNSMMGFSKFGIKFGTMDSGNDSSDPSSPTVSESESESYYSTLNHNFVSPAQPDSQGLKKKEISSKQWTYKGLMDQIVKNEEELRATNLKLQSAEQEVENLKKELEIREDENQTVYVVMEKEREIELQNQVVDMEIRLSNKDFEIRQLKIELKASRISLETCDELISSLREELHDCKQNFSMEKSKLETDINSLLKKQSLKETQFNKLKSKHDLQKSKMKSDTDGLVIFQREFDEVKLKLDEMAAELKSRDVEISQLKEEQNEISSKLELRVQKLEKEIEEKRMVISEGEEKKIEAIRQLCFSLDHYRTGYRELVRSLSGLKQHSVRAP